MPPAGASPTQLNATGWPTQLNVQPAVEHALPSLHYDRQVRQWRQVANLEPSKLASALIPQMDSVARQVGMSAGGEIILNGDGADQVLNVLRKYFAPGEGDAIYRKLVRNPYQTCAEMLSLLRTHTE